MLSFTGRSLRGRMMLLAMLSSGIGLALVYTEFFIFDFRDFCVRKGRDLETTAHLLSADASAALAFDDADRARQMLSALRAQQSIRAAVLYRRDGTSLAEYLRQDVARKFRRPRLAHLGAKWTKDSLSFAEQVCIEEKCAGTLYLEADLADVRSRLFHFAWVTVVMGVICLLLVRLLSKRLSRSIVRPIYDLAWTAGVVAGAKNFSLRAPILAGQEVGQLAADGDKRRVAAGCERNHQRREFRQTFSCQIAAAKKGWPDGGRGSVRRAAGRGRRGARAVWHLRRHYSAGRRRSEASRSQRGCRSGQPRQKRVFGQHEPRDPHANERDSRHDRARSRHKSKCRTA